MVTISSETCATNRSRAPLVASWMVLLVGLMSLHFVLIPILLHDSGFVPAFSPVSVQHADAVFDRIPVVRKLLSGLPAWGDLFVYENVSGLAVWPRLPYYLLALLSVPIADRLEALPLITTLLLTPVNAALLYDLSRRITRSQTQAIITTTLVLGFSELFVLQPWHWFNLGKVVDTLRGPIFFNAMVNPQISFIMLCGALIVLYRLVFTSGRNAIVLNALLYGSSFYTYFYSWTYLTGIYFAVGVYLLWRRDFRRLYLLVISVVAGLFLSILYWVDVLQFQQAPGYADFQDRFAIGRHIDLSERMVHLRPHVVTLVGFALVTIRRNARYLFLFLVLLTAELMWKLPVVLGMDFQTLHYASFIYGPVSGIVCVIIIGEVFSVIRAYVNRHLRIALVWGIGSCLLALIAYRATAYSTIYYPAFAIPEPVQSAYDYIRHHAAPGTVVLAADPEVNMRLRNAAPVYVYIPSGWASFTTTEEMIFRMAEVLQFYDIEPSDILEYPDLDWMLPGGPRGQNLIVPENYLFAMSTKYESQEERRDTIIAAVSEVDPGSLSYQVDVVWQGPYERQFGVNALDELPIIYQNELVTLYDYGRQSDSK